jgi:hypothetical protein
VQHLVQSRIGLSAGKTGGKPSANFLVIGTSKQASPVWLATGLSGAAVGSEKDEPGIGGRVGACVFLGRLQVAVELAVALGSVYFILDEYQRGAALDAAMQCNVPPPVSVRFFGSDSPISS